MAQRVAELTADQTPEGEISYDKMRSQVENVEREAAKQGQKAQREITATHKITGLRGLFRAVTGRPTTETRRHDRIADLQKSYGEVVDANVRVKAANENNEEVGYVGVHEGRSRMRSVVNLKDELRASSIFANIVKGIRDTLKDIFSRKKEEPEADDIYNDDIYKTEETLPARAVTSEKEPEETIEEAIHTPPIAPEFGRVHEGQNEEAAAPVTAANDEEGLQRDFNPSASGVVIMMPARSAHVAESENAAPEPTLSRIA